MTAKHEGGMGDIVDIAGLTHDELVGLTQDGLTPWRRQQTERKRLTCPYCGGWVSLHHTLSDDSAGASCSNPFYCGAEWASDGVLRTPSEFQESVEAKTARGQA